ncbi:MAG TPA: anti-sigma factor [Chitinivibrionales bacterium]|nr:anti-sigma factor [Chitinivibrionales bacterium]
MLFTSGELDKAQADELQKHLAACPPCKEEFSQYSLEKKKFYTLLCEDTSPDLDDKIISLCCRPAVPTTMGIFSVAWIKRAALSALIFALGLSAGGYFTFAYFQARTSGTYASQLKTPAASQPAASVAVTAAQKSPDTARHQSPTLLRQDKRVSPGVPSQGIITVDLKKE